MRVSGRLFPCFVTASRSCEIHNYFNPPPRGFAYEREEIRGDGEDYDDHDDDE